MNFEELNKIIKKFKLPQFREKQIKQAFFTYIENWEKISVLPKDLRNFFKEKLPWLVFKENKIVNSNDSQKAILELEDKKNIETVLINHKDGRNTICVSSQVGCPLRCKFCATGQVGFKRNLTCWEIVDQVAFWGQKLRKMNLKISNIVFMGMGEPFLNYKNVLKAIKILNNRDGFNIGARHISISTCGIISGIEKLSKENLQINLAISLHAPTDKLRSNLMPINRKYHIKKILRAIDNYIIKTNRRVMIEYLLINNVNDSHEDAFQLSALIKSRPLCYINIIPYNFISKEFKKSSLKNLKDFCDILNQNGIKYTIRHSFGNKISAACGQLFKIT